MDNSFEISNDDPESGEGIDLKTDFEPSAIAEHVPIQRGRQGGEMDNPTPNKKPRVQSGSHLQGQIPPFLQGQQIPTSSTASGMNTAGALFSGLWDKDPFGSATSLELLDGSSSQQSMRLQAPAPLAPSIPQMIPQIGALGPHSGWRNPAMLPSQYSQQQMTSLTQSGTLPNNLFPTGGGELPSGIGGNGTDDVSTGIANNPEALSFGMFTHQMPQDSNAKEAKGQLLGGNTLFGEQFSPAPTSNMTMSGFQTQGGLSHLSRPMDNQWGSNNPMGLGPMTSLFPNAGMDNKPLEAKLLNQTRNPLLLTPLAPLPFPAAGPLSPVPRNQFPVQPGQYQQVPVSRPRGIPLALSCDGEQLSEYQILVRQQLELFEASIEDIQSNTQGRKKQVTLGQVGIRCRHCAMNPLRQRGRGAVYYPTKLQGVYQAAQNMASSHLCESCQSIPPNLKLAIRALRERKDSASGGKRYWADGCRTMGLYETEDTGLRLRRKGSSTPLP
eukprot:Nitzschia sp. Nitz4//scaffold43_size134323//82888//84378//NITZ4_003309-RA/size134323-processed-gene-0.58-mRNA-1//-1//CDS//3329551978//1652//frame0